VSTLYCVVPNKEEGTGDWRKMYNEELCYSIPPSDVSRQRKYVLRRWAGYEARKVL
jgi:hypothetical protein